MSLSNENIYRIGEAIDDYRAGRLSPSAALAAIGLLTDAYRMIRPNERELVGLSEADKLAFNQIVSRWRQSPSWSS